MKQCSIAMEDAPISLILPSLSGWNLREGDLSQPIEDIGNDAREIAVRWSLERDGRARHWESFGVPY